MDGKLQSNFQPRRHTTLERRRVTTGKAQPSFTKQQLELQFEKVIFFLRKKCKIAVKLQYTKIQL